MKVNPQDGAAINMVTRVDALFLVDRHARGEGSNCTYAYNYENLLTSPACQGQYPQWFYGFDTAGRRIYRGVNPDQNGNYATDEITFWSVVGTRLATYQIITVPGNGPQTPPSLVFFQTSLRTYFGEKLLGGDIRGSFGNYYPYGQEKPSATPNGTEKFTGYFRDSETGLDYAINRFHNPGTGRFLTPDPYAGSADPADPGSWNRYAYVEGDPINEVDPDGLMQNCPNGDGCAGIGLRGPGGGPIFTGPRNKALPRQDRKFGVGGNGTAAKTQECVTSKTGSFVANNFSAAEELSDESGLPADFLLAWSAWETGWGVGSAAVHDGNFFGLTTTGVGKPDPGTGTGGWIGATACSAMNPSWFHGFACFDNGMSNNLYNSGYAALFSQNSRYGSAALKALQSGGSYADALEAIALAGFNIEDPNYGYTIMGGPGNAGTLQTIEKILNDCGYF